MDKVFLECVNWSEMLSIALILNFSVHLAIFLVYPMVAAASACFLGPVASLRRATCTSELLWGNKFLCAVCLVLSHLLFAPVAGD